MEEVIMSLTISENEYGLFNNTSIIKKTHFKVSLFAKRKVRVCQRDCIFLKFLYLTLIYR